MRRRYVLARGEARNYRAELTRGGDCILWCGEKVEVPPADYPDEFERWMVAGVGPAYVSKKPEKLYAEMPVLAEADGEKLVVLFRGEARLLPPGREVCGDVPETAVMSAGECPPLLAARAEVEVVAEVMGLEEYLEREGLEPGAEKALFVEPSAEMAVISQAVGFVVSFVDRVLY